MRLTILANQKSKLHALLVIIWFSSLSWYKSVFGISIFLNLMISFAPPSTVGGLGFGAQTYLKSIQVVNNFFFNGISPSCLFDIFLVRKIWVYRKSLVQPGLGSRVCQNFNSKFLRHFSMKIWKIPSFNKIEFLSKMEQKIFSVK